MGKSKLALKTILGQEGVNQAVSRIEKLMLEKAKKTENGKYERQQLWEDTAHGLMIYLHSTDEMLAEDLLESARRSFERMRSRKLKDFPEIMILWKAIALALDSSTDYILFGFENSVKK